MKVIKKGRKQKGWSKEYLCSGKGNGDGGCGATLLVERDDIFATKHEHYDGSTTFYKTFRCPECGVMTDIPDSDFPFTPRWTDNMIGIDSKVTTDKKK